MSTYAEENDIETLIEANWRPYEKLRKRFEGREEEPSMLLRFLIGTGYDVELATQRLKASLQWRDEVKFDDLIERYKDTHPNDFPHCEKIMRFFPHNDLYAINNESLNIIAISKIGSIHAQGFVENVTIDNLLEYQLAVIANKIARMNQLCRDTGVLVRDELVIDLEGLSMSHVTSSLMNYLQTISSVLEANFPEMLSSVFIINAPTVFSAAWKVICGFIDENTKNKVTILGSEWRDVLYDRIPREALPLFLGGENEEAICVNYEEKHDEVAVSRKSVFETEVQLRRGETVNWEMRTLQDRHVDVEVVFNRRVVTSLESPKSYVIHGGDYVAKRSGVLRMRFHNQSWKQASVVYNLRIKQN